VFGSRTVRESDGHLRGSRLSRLKTGPLVYLEWLDHVGSGDRGWIGEDEVGTVPSTVRSVGWIYKEDRKTLTIVGNHAEHDEQGEPELSGVHCILKSCITRRVTLRDPSRRK
jgi:hypothetical protein